MTVRHGEVQPAVPRWAPWTGDGVTLHLVRDVPDDDPVHGLGACARYDVTGMRLVGTTISLNRARTLDQHDAVLICRECAVIALAEVSLVAADAAEAAAAYRIRAELVCCDAYDRRRELYDADSNFDQRPGFHAICYWGEAAAREAERADDDDDVEENA